MTERQEQIDQEELMDLRETSRQRARRQQLEAVEAQAKWEKLIKSLPKVKTKKQTLEEVRLDKARRGGALNKEIPEPELLRLLEQQDLIDKGSKEPWIEDVLNEKQTEMQTLLKELRAFKVEMMYKNQLDRLGEVVLTVTMVLIALLALMGWLI